LDRLNKKYYKAARISGFIVIIFETERRFGEQVYKPMVKSFVDAAKGFGNLNHILSVNH
jgi:hypothetical protein